MPGWGIQIAAREFAPMDAIPFGSPGAQVCDQQHFHTDRRVGIIRRLRCLRIYCDSQSCIRPASFGRPATIVGLPPMEHFMRRVDLRQFNGEAKGVMEDDASRLMNRRVTSAADYRKPE